MALENECFPDRVRRRVKENLGDEAEEFLKGLPDFGDAYQSWYSEAKALVRQVLPDRLSDFVLNQLMITVLVVGEEKELEGLSSPKAALEVLRAHSAEEALEKLGRNRRIDAVLLLERDGIPAVVEAIREDNRAHPPIFLPSGRQAPPGTRILPGEGLAELLDLLSGEVQG